MRPSLTSAALAIATIVLTFGSTAAAMTYEKVTGAGECAVRTCVVASGEIGGDDAEAFAGFLKRQDIRPGSLLILNSPGGDLVQALTISGHVRKAGLSTHVGSYDHRSGELRPGGACASACAYAFLGGVSRTASKGAKLGVHQLHAQRGDVSIADSQLLTSMIAANIKRLGGSVDILIVALRTPPESMHWMSRAELIRFQMVTGELESSPAAGQFVAASGPDTATGS